MLSLKDNIDFFIQMACFCRLPSSKIKASFAMSSDKVKNLFTYAIHSGEVEFINRVEMYMGDDVEISSAIKTAFNTILMMIVSMAVLPFSLSLKKRIYKLILS